MKKFICLLILFFSLEGNVLLAKNNIMILKLSYGEV